MSETGSDDQHELEGGCDLLIDIQNGFKMQDAPCLMILELKTMCSRFSFHLTKRGLDLGI